MATNRNPGRYATSPLMPARSMTAPLSIDALPTGEACVFYGAVYQELLRALTGFEGALIHEHCRSRGEEACVWRTAVAEVYE